MDWIARLLGVFYLLAGILVLRRLAMDRLFDQAIARIACKPPPRDEVTQSRLLLIGACLTFASGLALATLSRWSLALFVANALFQSGHILWARRATPPEDVAEQHGRRAAINAWVCYLIGTAFVAFCAYDGTLRPWTFLPPLAQHPWVELAIVAVCTGLLAWHHLRAANLDPAPRGERVHDTVPDTQILPEPPLPSPNKPLRLAPEVGCWPLWNDETGDNLDPARLPIPSDLVDELMRWDAKYQATFDPLNPAASGFPTREAEIEFRAEAKALASSLRTVWLGGVVLRLDPSADASADSGNITQDRHE